MSALAAFAEGSLSRLSQVVARLERKGYVRRHPDPADGRHTLATLTDEGYRKMVSAARPHRPAHPVRHRPRARRRRPAPRLLRLTRRACTAPAASFIPGHRA
ncbi:MarR family winged helix-turn-helix transcriptional regulator [Streptomyces sp. NRRL S-455]